MKLLFDYMFTFTKLLHYVYMMIPEEEELHSPQVNMLLIRIHINRFISPEALAGCGLGRVP